MILSANDDDFATDDDVRRELNFVERIKGIFGVEDDYVAAQLANQARLGKLLRKQTQRIESLGDAFEDFARSQGVTLTTDPALMFAWPSPPAPANGAFQASEVKNLIGTFAQGRNEFDFQTGEVTIGNDRTEYLSSSLNKINAPHVRSFHVVSDTPVEWYIPNQEMGRYQESQLSWTVNDIEAERLVIKSDAHSFGQVLASTRPTTPLEPTGTESQTTKVATEDGTPTVTVGTSYEEVAMTTESELYRDGTTLAILDPYVGQLRTVSLIIDNDDAEDLHVNLRAKNELHVGDLGDFFDIPYVDVSGWTTNAPKVIPANETKLFTVDVPFRLLQIRAKAASNTTDFQLAMTGITE